MKKFFGKIIALFSGEKDGGVVEPRYKNSELEFFDFRPNPYATICNCKKYVQQEILIASRISLKDAFKQYSPIGYELSEEDRECCFKYNYEKYGVEISFKIIIDDEYFSKRACVTCQTCLGWSFYKGPHYGYFGMGREDVKNPQTKVIEIFQEREAEFLEDLKKKEIAKRVCGVE